MKQFKSAAIGALPILFLPLLASALTVVECVDADGTTSFRDSCPPGVEVKGTKELPGKRKDDIPPSVADVAKDNPVVLFVAPNCNACDLVKILLEKTQHSFRGKRRFQ